MDLSAQQVADQIWVTVTITNTGAGHHVPTDYPGRHLILTVSVTDSVGAPATQLVGPTVPLWGGSQAGEPGTAYAKVLQDLANGEWPVVSYWKQTTILTDNRIPALEADITHYTFAAPVTGGELRVTARLILRRVFQSLADQKGWQTPDYLMAVSSETILPQGWHQHYLPVVRKDP